MAGLMALFMDNALRRSLDAEDILVMEAQTRELIPALAHGGAPGGTGGPRPEKVEWQLLREGEEARKSSGFPALDPTRVRTGSTEEVWVQGRAFLVTGVAVSGGVLVLAVDRTHEEALVAGFRRTLLLAVAASAVLAALLGRFVAGRGLLPLHQLAEETATIQPGSLGHRLDPSGYPIELGEVVERLNGALGRLEEAFDRLSNLAGELAHELRTPLQALRAEAESLLRTGQGPPEALGSMVEECDRLAAQVEQMLFLARTEDPGNILQRIPVLLPGFIEEVREFFEAAAEEAEVELTGQAEPGLILMGDPGLLRRALHNLVINALRHTPPGGQIQIEAGSAKGSVSLRVRDSGSGIDAGLRPRLGHRWAKGEGSRGLGLGLAIVRSIVRLHGGEMAIQDGKACGTEVRLEFLDLKKT